MTPAPASKTIPPPTTTRVADADGASAVSVSGLTKRYGHRVAVAGLDLELPRGVVAGFVGPNGSGKTTTMAMLLGLVRPTAGEGTVLGRSITDPGAYLHRVGALIESPAFYPSLTGVENLRLFATVGRRDGVDVDGLLATVGLADRGRDRYRTYSLGMKQRLGIAAALLGDPELLILDEPTNGLDPQGVREVRGLVGELASESRTVLVSSHDLSELEQICDWLLLIDAGAVVYQGPTHALLESGSGGLRVVTEHDRELAVLRAALADAGFEVDALDDGLLVGAAPGGDSDPAVLGAAINRCAFGAGIVVAELHPQRTTLEDRFLDLIRGGTS
jgi:ABC-2 type transport system ATP-binding protein